MGINDLLEPHHNARVQTELGLNRKQIKPLLGQELWLSISQADLLCHEDLTPCVNVYPSWVPALTPKGSKVGCSVDEAGHSLL